MITIRVGRGQSPSGKIIDSDTKWFTEVNDAISYHLMTGKKIYISKNHKKYFEVSLNELIKY